MTAPILTGLLVGIAFGFALQRGRFCMNSAFRDIVTMKDYTLLKTVALALLVSMLGFGIMAMTNTITPNPKPILWGGNIIGSFIFGIGMVLAGGCASGITYRVGEGMVGAMTAVLGLTLTAIVTKSGFLTPAMEFLQKARFPAEGSTTVASILNLPYATVAIGGAIILGLIWWFFTRKNKGGEVFDAHKDAPLTDKMFKYGWPWVSTGVVIGLIGIISFPLSAWAGRNYPLGITSGWLKIGWMFMPSVPFEKSYLAWDMWLIVGIVVGAAIAALIAKEFKLRMPAGRMLVQTFIGGTLMGFGAVCSTGCNIGHILSGVPQLSIGSLIAGTSIVLGAWLAAYLMFVRPMAKD